MFRIESLLSSRLFLQPQLVGRRIFFSQQFERSYQLICHGLWRKRSRTSTPAGYCVTKPRAANGYPFYVFPQTGKILVTIDRVGDENYQPMLIPVEGGFRFFKKHLNA